MIVKVHEAKTNLSKLIARAEAGEEVIIARGNEPAVRLVPVNANKAAVRGYGRFAHLSHLIPEDLFLSPMPEDDLQAWEGKYSFPADNG